MKHHPSMFLACSLLVVGTAATADARLIRVGSLDNDATGNAFVAVGTITGVRAGASDLRTGLQHVTLVVRVEAAIHLSRGPDGKAPSHIKVAHARRIPDKAVKLHSSYPVGLDFGRTYLLFLRRDSSSSYRVVAPEDPYLIEIPSYLSWIWKQCSPRSTILENVALLLESKLSRCHRGCHAEIWLLGNSRRYRGLLEAASSRKKRFIAGLRRIAASSVESNTLLATYTVLGFYDDRSVIRNIVDYACNPPRRNRPDPPSAAIGWLQGFGVAVQRKALKRILRCARDRQLRLELHEAVKRLRSMRGAR